MESDKNILIIFYRNFDDGKKMLELDNLDEIDDL